MHSMILKDIATSMMIMPDVWLVGVRYTTTPAMAPAIKIALSH